jgi:hypothetical protein
VPSVAPLEALPDVIMRAYRIGFPSETISGAMRQAASYKYIPLT